MARNHSPEGEVLAAHMEASRAVFQTLVNCLERSGALRPGEVADMIRVHMETVKSTADPMTLAQIHDYRAALLG